MSIYKNPRGRSSFGLALCGRCQRKHFLDDLSPDPNMPGLMVCRKDIDELDPYLLPMRAVEDITLRYVRPDEPLVVGASPSPAPAPAPAPSGYSLDFSQAANSQYLAVI